MMTEEKLTGLVREWVEDHEENNELTTDEIVSEVLRYHQHQYVSYDFDTKVQSILDISGISYVKYILSNIEE